MNLRHFFLAGLCLLLAGCAASSEKRAAHDGPLLPMPDGLGDVHDPDDGLFVTAATEWIESIGAPRHSLYEFTRIDLNGDGRRDALAMMQSPYMHWCMEYGCTMLVFRAHDDGFSLLSEISPVRGPLVVGPSETNGWKDINVRVSGRSGWKAKDVALKFDGKTYPAQPAFQKAVLADAGATEGIKIFP